LAVFFFSGVAAFLAGALALTLLFLLCFLDTVLVLLLFPLLGSGIL